MTITRENVDSIDFSCEQIDFDSNIAKEDLEFVLDKINSFDVELQTIHVNLKALTFDSKKIAIKFFLANVNLKHPEFLLNLINLIKNYNSLSEEFFGNEKVLFTDLEEFLNIKLELKDEIQQFIDDFTVHYFAMMMSLHKIESNFLDNVKVMPNTYLSLIRALDFVTLSGICSKSKNLYKPNFYISDSIDIFQTLLGKMSYTNQIMQLLLSNIEKEMKNVSNS